MSEPRTETEPDVEPQSAIATRDARIARREGHPGRRTLRFLQEFLPLIVLTGTVVGALMTFYARQVGGSPAEDIAIAVGFGLALLIIAYLNPQVQLYFQTRGGRNHD